MIVMFVLSSMIIIVLGLENVLVRETYVLFIFS